MDELNNGDQIKFVRRSERNPEAAVLARADVQHLLEKIRTDHPDTVILKIKDHTVADINSLVLEEVIRALKSNTVCEALYAQNLSKVSHHSQCKASEIDVLHRHRNIYTGYARCAVVLTV